jgi:acetolactate synthase-1/2/3 large subunit
MKASDFIATFLQKKGIKNVFELSGGMITHLLDSISQTTDINIISMHHEQAAAFAAEGYARITGLPGIAFATSGPGATNLLTGIGSCFFDSTPAIFITGQVNRSELKGDRKIRQLGFQETDILSMANPITKACFLITEPNDIPEIFEKAFKIALEGRPGPVLIDIPMDVQRSIIEPNFYINDQEEDELESNISDEIIQDLISNINSSKKPLILAGRGIKASQSQKLFDTFKIQTKIPVITSLLGLDTIMFNDIQRVGFIGSYGNRWANIAFGECDLLIVLGSRMDIRQTGADVDFIKNRKIFHVDCEEAEINNRVKGCVGIKSDLNYFFKKFTQISSNSFFDKKVEWVENIKNLKYKWPDIKELVVTGINPNKFIHNLSSKSKDAIAYLADVGSHQMWAAQSLELYNNQFFLTSGGMGAMGFSIPAAIGACIASGNKPIVVIIGDGCMQINIQELQTIVRNKLNIKIVVLNNKSLGMIRQFQDSYFESRYQSTFWGYDAPNFSKIAEAYQIESKTIEKIEEIDAGIEWIWSIENKPQLLQVMIEPNTNCYPKIAFGRPINEMEPFSKPLGMEST